MNILPPTWQQSQLQALNDLNDTYNAYLLVDRLMTLTNNQNTPVAIRIRQDLIDQATRLMQILATYPA